MSVKKNKNINYDKRNINKCVLFTILTGGIYAIKWLINIVYEVDNACDGEKTPISPGTALLLMLITCGLFGIYYIYQIGYRLAYAGKKHDIPIDNNSNIYLLLAIINVTLLGFLLNNGITVTDIYLYITIVLSQVVSFVMIQRDLNKIADKYQ